MDWPILSVLDDPQRRTLLSRARRRRFARARRRRFARNEVIFHEGDPGDTLHLLGHGHVAIRVSTPLGDTATLRVLSAGEFFGELAVIAPAPRNATAVAIDVVETLTLHRDDVDELRSRHPMLERVLIEALVTEIRRLAVQLLDALYVPVERRVWRRLNELGRTFADGSPGRTTIPLTKTRSHRSSGDESGRGHKTATDTRASRSRIGAVLRCDHGLPRSCWVVWPVRAIPMGRVPGVVTVSQLP